MLDKIPLRKYFCQQDFTVDDRAEMWNTEKETLEYAWDEKYVFFQQVKNIFLNEKNLFQKIADENKLPHFFPENLKKLKLSKALLGQFFTEISLGL